MTEQPDGSYRLDRITPADEFNDLELYLMGLVGPAAVADHIVLQNQDQRDQVTHGGILQGPVEVIGIGDVIAANGPRVPGVGDAQTDFRLGTIVLSHGRLLDESEMAFFDHMAARGAARDELPFTGGLVRGTAKPFFLATGGRATLSTTVLDAVEAPLDVFILVDLSGSFADDLAVFRSRPRGSSRASRRRIPTCDSAWGNTKTIQLRPSDRRTLRAGTPRMSWCWTSPVRMPS